MTRALALFALLFACAVPAFAQEVKFQSLKQDSSLPVQVTSDSLAVDQSGGIANFEGNVVVTQGDMVIKSAKARVENKADGSGVDKIYFTGPVTFHSPTEAAASDGAVYTVDSGEVVMTGNVLLTQGKTTIAGQKLVYDLQKGTGQMQGRVQTTFIPKSAKDGKDGKGGKTGTKPPAPDAGTAP